MKKTSETMADAHQSYLANLEKYGLKYGSRDVMRPITAEFRSNFSKRINWGQIADS